MAEKMGILGRKLGMTRIFAGDGSAVAVTVVQAGPCPVTQVKTAETDGYNALQIAFEEAKEKHVTKPMKGHFAKAGTALYRKVREIRLDGPAAYEVGAVLTADVFAAGDKIKVTGNKAGDKLYHRHTGHPGGVKTRVAGKILEGKYPERVLQKAVERMLPKESPLARAQMTHLRILAGSEHTHEAQKPEVIDFAGQNAKNARGQ